MSVEIHFNNPDQPVAPKIQNPFYDAVEHDKAGRRKEAERIYIDLLNADFDNGVLLAALGMNYAVAEKNGLAHVLLNRALERIPYMVGDFKKLGIIPKQEGPDFEVKFLAMKRSEVMNALGTCFKHENKIPEARKCFEDAQAGMETNPDIQNNLGTIYINEGKPEEAMKHLELALSVAPDHAQAHWNLALAQLESGDYERGWPNYEYGFKAQVRQERNYSKEPIPYWDGSPGKRIVVFGEQGIGDEILFASCLPDLMAVSKSVVFECHKKLHTLFANSFPTLDIFPTREDEVITWPVHQDGSMRYEFDARVAIGSLPSFFRKNIESFPGKAYIEPRQQTQQYWADRLAALGNKPKIGISWIGGHKRTRVEVRSIALESLLPILKQDATFISLQYTQCETEIAEFEAKHGIKLHHFPDACHSHNYDDTAGLVSNLDLVITVCTSVVHLAGSMGVPTWVLTPSRPAWRYRLDLDRLPWYPQVLLFRQAHDSVDWAPVISEVAEALKSLMSKD